MAGAAGMFPENKRFWKSALPKIKDYFDIYENKFFFDVTHGRFCNLLRSVGRVLYSFEKRRWALCHKNDKSLRHLICWKRAKSEWLLLGAVSLFMFRIHFT